MRFGGVNMTS